MGRIALLNKEVLFLFVICALDTLSSAVLFHGHYAIEANPLLRSFADAGTIPFIIAKSATFLPALLLAFWYGRRRPEFVRPLLRAASAVYLVVYLSLVVRQFIA